MLDLWRHLVACEMLAAAQGSIRGKATAAAVADRLSTEGALGWSRVR